MRLSTLKKFCDQFAADASGSMADLLADMRSGRAELTVPAYEKADFAPLLQALRGVLPSLSRIVREPVSVLRGELTLRRAETVSTLSPLGIRETLRDMRLWKVKGGALRPESVYAPENVEETDLYENRLVKALVDRALRFLRMGVRATRSGVRILRDMHLQSAALSKVDFVRLLGDRPDACAQSGATGGYREAVSLRRRFLRLRQTPFYRAMAKFPAFTDAEPRVTDIFIANKRYRDCLELWRFLNRFESELSGLSGEERRSAYTAYVAFSLAAAYEKRGFSLERNAYFRNVLHGFSLPGLVFGGEGFRVIMDAEPGRIDLVVQCPQEKVQQRLRIGVYANTADEPSASDYLSVSLFDLGYGDRFVCASPENEDSQENMLAIARLTTFIMRGDVSAYDALCPVCGSTLVVSEEYCMHCEECGAKYRGIGKDSVWIHSFAPSAGGYEPLRAEGAR